MSLNEAVKNLSRREALLVGVAATAAACSSDPMPTSDAAADAPGADVTGNDTAVQPDAPTPDVAAMDVAPDAPPPPDATNEAGVVDAGADAGPDAAPDAPAPDAAPDAPGPDAAPDAPAPDAAAPDAAADMSMAMCPPPGATRLGPVTDFPVGSWRNVKAARVIVGRDARGIFAYSSVCTHAGCTVPAPAAGGTSECPCHGSQYNADGVNTRGPTTRPLQNFGVVVCAGVAYLDISMVVASGTRTAV